jgi:hypothetical protein
VGFDVHITRADEWSRNENQEILADEWLAFVDADPELTRDPENGAYAAAWVDKANFPDAWLDWFEGNIYTTNPDPATVEKMLQISAHFQAHVQGDDGKVYQQALDES